MIRRLLPALLAAAALTLAACGDDEETVPPSASGETSAERTTETQAETKPSEPASGCRKVDQPEPKDVELGRPKQRLDAGRTWVAVMKTSCGTFEITLDVEENPRTASSFAHLVREGFYDNLSFHRVVPGFVAQGGDPEGTGQGGPGYSVTEAPPRSEKYPVGTVAMAKTEIEDPGTSGSQFFVVTGTQIPLEPLYAVVGRVSKGDEVVELIGNAPNDPADNRPTQPIVIEKATLRSG